jgi:hypothetical protein
MIQKDGSILLHDWAKGIGQSYLSDLKNIQCVDIFSVPGVAFPNQEMAYMGVDLLSYTSRTFTADASLDRITASAAVFTTGQAVRVSSTGTLPAGLSSATTYYIIAVSGAVYKLATTINNALAGTAVDITDAGTGTHSIIGTQMGRVKKIVQNPGSTTGNFRAFVLDESGKVWTQVNNLWSHLPGNATGSGQGMEIWKNYLFVIGDSGVISTYGSLTNVGGSAAWTATWKTATGSDSFVAPTVNGSDDLLYIAQGRYISTVEEDAAPFVPATAGSYIWTDIALDLPTSYRIRCMCENGVDLAIGTWIGSTYPDVFTASLEVKKADIFFWDRSDSTFRLPVHIEENGVNQIISINNLVYAMCGQEGRMYITNGTSSELFTQIPISVFDRQQNTTQHLFFFPFAIAYFRGRILVGVSSGSVSSSPTLSPLGVYAINPATGAIAIEQIGSTDNTGLSGSVGIAAIVATSEQEMYVGFYYDGSQTVPGRIDRITSNTLRYGAGCLIESGLYSVGSADEKTNFPVVEFMLGKALASSETVTLYFRRTSTGSWTQVVQLTNSTENQGSLTKIRMNTPLLADLTDVQFKVEPLGTLNATGPELIAVHIRKN